ncbi:MAG: baseplate J/gp47 family protein [Clostridium sp.]|jgi:uncharacterized phage protein gp47/JayE|nr:baseplate J/gp47 family protein [Clostridium sp.]
MFEDKTTEAILESLLAQVDETFDKRQGSVIYDALAPAATELARLYVDLAYYYDQSFPDTAEGEYLERFASAIGFSRLRGIPAVIFATYTPSAVNIATGTRFSGGGHTYTVTSMGTGGYVSLTCEQDGVAGGLSAGSQLLPIDFVEGLQTVTVSNVTTAGVDQWTDDDLRNAIKIRMSRGLFVGSVDDWKAFLSLINIVGACVVNPLSINDYSGAGYAVRIYVVGVDFKPISSSYVSQLQALLDPGSAGSTMGCGLGVAPIGQQVYVATPTNKTINITITKTGTVDDDWLSGAATEIEKYFAEVRANYGEMKLTNDGWKFNYIRTSRLKQILYSLEGATNLNITAVTMSSGSTSTTGDWELSYTDVPILGTVA